MNLKYGGYTLPSEGVSMSEGTTTDRNDPALDVTEPGGQQKKYLVLSDDERAKGFVRPLRNEYTHLKCGTKTNMAPAIAETYARQPGFYTSTFCWACATHVMLRDADGKHTFEWADGQPVGE